MHWSIECNERLQEVNLQVIKLKKLLDAELPCDKEIAAEVKLMKEKWDRFEKAHHKHRSAQNNDMRAMMDQVHREAVAKHDAVMEALAQKNATIAAAKKPAKNAAVNAAIETETAAKKTQVEAAEEEAAASADKKGAEEVALTAKRATKEKRAEEDATANAKKRPEEKEKALAKKNAEKQEALRQAEEKTERAAMKATAANKTAGEAAAKDEKVSTATKKVEEETGKNVGSGGQVSCISDAPPSSASRPTPDLITNPRHNEAAVGAALPSTSASTRAPTDGSPEGSYYLEGNLLIEEYWIKMYEEEPNDAKAIKRPEEAKTMRDDYEEDLSGIPLGEACMECDECPQLISEEHGIMCHYCGCSIHRHGKGDRGTQEEEIDDPLESEMDETASLNLSACGEDKLLEISQSEGSSDEGEEEKSMRVLHEGFQKYISMELFGEKILLQPGHHIWEKKMKTWSTIEWTASVKERAESSLMSTKICGFLLEMGREEDYRSGEDLEGEVEGENYITLALKLNATKREAALLSETQVLTRLDIINICLYQDWVGRCAIGIAPFSRFAIKSYSAEGDGYMIEEVPGRIQATTCQTDGIHLGIMVEMSFKENDYAQIKGLIEMFYKTSRAEVFDVSSESQYIGEAPRKKQKRSNTGER